jgi:hypothetical protein
VVNLEIEAAVPRRFGFGAISTTYLAGVPIAFEHSLPNVLRIEALQCISAIGWIG